MPNDQSPQGHSVPAKAQISTGGPLKALVPTTVDEAYRLAQALAAAGEMIPQHFQNNPQKCMAAIARGMEVGLAPMQALASIAVINGRATLWGDAIPALMQRAGHHIDVEYEGGGNDLVAVASLTRGDTGKTIVRRFGMADAKRAGLLEKKGPWQQYPQRMLAMRARSWACRDGAADALMGLGIAEEAQDYGPDTARDVTPKAPRRGGVIMKPAQPVPEPAEDVDEIIEGQSAPAIEDHEAFTPTPEDLARAEAEARAAINSQDMENEG